MMLLFENGILVKKIFLELGGFNKNIFMELKEDLALEHIIMDFIPLDL